MKKSKIQKWESISTSPIDRPDWVHPQSTAFEWFVPKTGFKVDPSQSPTCSKYVKVNFNYKFCNNSNATDLIWNLITKDLKSSAIALIESSTSKRPSTLVGFIRTAFEVIDHALELRIASNRSPKILTLSDITKGHIKSFLEAHDLVAMGIHVSALNAELGSTVRNRKNISDKIAMMDIPSITRKALIQKLKDRDAAASEREFDSAYELDDNDQALSISTIQNKCTDISYLHITKEHQEYQFEIGKHEITDMLNDVSKGFTNKNQTPLMPTNIAFHYISHAIKFHRDYAPSLRKYIQDLDTYYTANILSKYAKSTIRSNSHIFKRQVLEAVPMPNELKSLNIKTYGKCSFSRGKYESHADLRDHISTRELIDFYAITTRILIHTFTACRLLSASLLDKDCLTLSKMDGLWDIKLKIPKSSSSNELEIIKRPIPKVIWDFIYDYISFMEDRHPGMASIWPSDTHKDVDRDERVNRKMLDQYSDWIAVPLIDQKRWYARPHQFRRFFAAFFFYLSEGTDIEPLRWMMGHIEPSITLYYADISTQADWERETLEFLTAFLEGNVGKDVLVDDDLEEDLSECSLQVKLGDHALLAEHLRELSSHRNIKLKILNDQKIYIYASK
ncbi:conserved hypothetical protein [Pseudomonas sp. OF001]|uniref:hypothetical protein n=1 Tax=Pseudomonas sp. OF001 TaxID=2772300 RepID=UPI0019195187|nr:hypothetical protein [Pseudomonas sp. OF001]CAD5378649.1 conserved hypothetical protein [Pseudomonas sp. OF001]